MDVSRALDAGEFEVHYQPIVRLADRRPAAVEALIRWRHPTRGLLAPSIFLPFAETTGLMTEIGTWVLQRACADMMESDARFDLCVNVSDTQLIGSGLVEAVLSALTETGFPAQRLVLEVCERTVVPDLLRLGRALTALRTLGVRIALDDFGAGFSSLERLNRLPLDIVKVDACLVRGVAGRGNERQIVSAIIRLAHSLELSVVSEGVESADQADALQAEGCLLAQGYLFARPGTIDDLHGWADGTAAQLATPSLDAVTSR